MTHLQLIIDYEPSEAHFSLCWNIFYHSGFWATCACPENGICPENFQVSPPRLVRLCIRALRRTGCNPTASDWVTESASLWKPGLWNLGVRRLWQNRHYPSANWD